MTPDIRPRPSPGSRIYSKEGTPPPNWGITQRVGRWTLNQGQVVNSHASIIHSPKHEPLLGFRTISREDLLNKQPSMVMELLPLMGPGMGLSLKLYLAWAVGEKLPSATHRWALNLHPLLSHCLDSPQSLSLAWTTQLHGTQADFPWQEVSLLPLGATEADNFKQTAVEDQKVFSPHLAVSLHPHSQHSGNNSRKVLNKFGTIHTSHRTQDDL